MISNIYRLFIILILTDFSLLSITKKNIVVFVVPQDNYSIAKLTSTIIDSLKVENKDKFDISITFIVHSSNYFIYQNIIEEAIKKDLNNLKSNIIMYNNSSDKIDNSIYNNIGKFNTSFNLKLDQLISLYNTSLENNEFEKIINKLSNIVENGKIDLIISNYPNIYFNLICLLYKVENVNKFILLDYCFENYYLSIFNVSKSIPGEKTPIEINLFNKVYNSIIITKSFIEKWIYNKSTEILLQDKRIESIFSNNSSNTLNLLKYKNNENDFYTFGSCLEDIESKWSNKIINIGYVKNNLKVSNILFKSSLKSNYIDKYNFIIINKDIAYNLNINLDNFYNKFNSDIIFINNEELYLASNEEYNYIIQNTIAIVSNNYNDIILSRYYFIDHILYDYNCYINHIIAEIKNNSFHKKINLIYDIKTLILLINKLYDEYIISKNTNKGSFIEYSSSNYFVVYFQSILNNTKSSKVLNSEEDNNLKIDDVLLLENNINIYNYDLYLVYAILLIVYAIIVKKIITWMFCSCNRSKKIKRKHSYTIENNNELKDKKNN